MNDMQNDLNTLLQGSHMGIEIYADLLKKIESDSLRRQVYEALEMCKHHENELHKRMHALCLQADDMTVMSTMSAWMEKIKNMTLSDDAEIKRECISSIQMGIDQLQAMMNKHCTADHPTEMLLQTMMEDYHAMHQAFQTT